ncbi:unnamed protein product [Angiostrongylus costaricensis]|uniref:Uncharacterized protein n=1 Tax=Angiostrongylus costaricensis TaxID=334426 RepID=A0A0R3PTW1_ANGCS|nr:unnamed protein product [Angiostrongylus costaricensis]
MVQKFYWKRVVRRYCYNISLLFSHNINSFNHLLVTIGWSFCLFWSRFFTSNKVSNLFINEWGSGTDDIEIEALQEHFYRDTAT